MTPFEIYTLVICLIVYVLLAGLGTYMVLTVYRLSVKLIRSGANDEEILCRYEKEKNRKRKKTCALDCISSIFLCAFLVAVFIFSSYAGCTKELYFDDMPTFKIVNSSSMAKKNEKNQYLFDNHLDNQFQTFDLILTYKIPPEEELRLYDIVVYEVDDILVVHRIVGIEEPGKTHPDERWFLCQGDAISQADRFPVKYEQMRAIYKNERIPFVGSFVAFMQSPVGYMCMILVAIAMIATPIMEKKMDKATAERLAILLPPPPAPIDPFAHLKGAENNKTFAERLAELDGARARYEGLFAVLSRIAGIRTIESKKARTFKCGSVPLVRMSIRGKTLNAQLALPPAEFENTKYIFTDLSESEKHKNYPMRLRLTSERQERWTVELILEMVTRAGLTLLPESAPIPQEHPFAHLKGAENNKTFAERLAELDEARARYEALCALLGRIVGIRMIESKKARTFKSGNTPLVRMSVRGKTLNAQLSLPPAEFANTKYVFTDLSESRKHKNYPMRVKLSSARQLRYTGELILDMVARGGLTLLPESAPIPESPFERLKGKKKKTFYQKLKLSPTAKARFEELRAEVEGIRGARRIDAKGQITYKIKNAPLARFVMRGKTLNLYLGLRPEEYADSKYIFTDVSGSQKHKNYPMRLRITSERQVRWAKELIAAAAEKAGAKV